LPISRSKSAQRSVRDKLIRPRKLWDGSSLCTYSPYVIISLSLAPYRHPISSENHDPGQDTRPHVSWPTSGLTSIDARHLGPVPPSCSTDADAKVNSKGSESAAGGGWHTNLASNSPPTWEVSIQRSETSRIRYPLEVVPAM